MKRMKSLLGLVLALALVLSLSMAVFADGKISITDPNTTKTYTIYKIFDATVDSNNDITYTIEANSLWLDVIKDKVEGLELIPDANPATKYTVREDTGYSAANFAEYLKSNIPTGATVAATLSDDGDATTDTDFVSGVLAKGYYLIVPSGDDQVAGLTTITNSDVGVQDKNDMPFDKTVDGQQVEGVQIGDVLQFEISSKVPAVDPANDTYYAFLVSDIMSAGLQFNKDVTVFIETDTTNHTGITIIPPVVEVTNPLTPLTGDQIRYGAVKDATGNAEPDSFELSIEFLQRVTDHPEYAGKPVYIRYTATVLPEAQGKVEKNFATLEYGNNPDNLKIKESETKVYNSRIIVDKYETGAPEQKLSGAKFVLRNDAATIADEVENGGTTYQKYTNGTNTVLKNGTKWYDSTTYTEIDPFDSTGYELVTTTGTGYYTYDSTSKVITWVTDKNDAILETNAEGRIDFIGLKDGTYYLEEVEAPAGYVGLTAPIEVVIDGSDATSPRYDANEQAMILTNTVSVANTPGTVLPSTGGRGTTMLYMAGLGMMLAAGAFLIFRRRAEAGK